MDGQNLVITPTEEQANLLRFGYRYVNSERKAYSFLPLWLKEDLESGENLLVENRQVPVDILNEVFSDFLYGTGFGPFTTNVSDGVNLIAQERWEQLYKHHWNRDEAYTQGELLHAALFALSPLEHEWPEGWSEHFRQKILNKSYEQRLQVAGAFIAAELDRLTKEQNTKNQTHDL